MKKLLYILAIFAAVLLFDSCTKEEITICNDHDGIENPNWDSRGLVDQGGGGGDINDRDDEEDEEDEDDEIGDPDDDEDENDEDNDVVEGADDTQEGA